MVEEEPLTHNAGFARNPKGCWPEQNGIIFRDKVLTIDHQPFFSDTGTTGLRVSFTGVIELLLNNGYISPNVV